MGSVYCLCGRDAARVKAGVKTIWETAMSEVTIRLREDGPLVVTGRVRIVDQQGNEIAIPEGKGNVALCRCGRSGNKPFCDGRHREGAPGEGKPAHRPPPAGLGG